MSFLREIGSARTERTADAMATVPREAFLEPGLAASEVYANAPYLLKTDRRGRAVSTISQPSMIATMLDQLRPERGDRILEVGTASGYNAALLAHLVGPPGLVVSIEIEADLAAAAARSLQQQKVDNAVVICADGMAGWPQAAPFDGIVVTAAANRVEPRWVEQLAEGGRLVVPIAPSGMGTCFAFEKRDGDLIETDAVPCGFVPLRATPADT